MNFADILVLVLVLALVGLAVFLTHRRKKYGSSCCGGGTCSSCGGNCASCGKTCTCGKKKSPKK